jgi:hypothetical protein
MTIEIRSSLEIMFKITKNIKVGQLFVNKITYKIKAMKNLICEIASSILSAGFLQYNASIT